MNQENRDNESDGFGFVCVKESFKGSREGGGEGNRGEESRGGIQKGKMRERGTEKKNVFVLKK